MAPPYIYVAHVVRRVMSKQHTVYYQEEEEELAEWVEEYEDVLGGRSAFIKRGLRLLRKDYGDEIRALSEEEEPDITV